MIMQRLSLLARGTLTHHIRVRPRDRLIPAGAGNTTTHQDRYTPRPVYPRWRGEHFVQSEWFRFRVGLSPLARGTRLRRVQKSIKASVYPRWRGEHSFQVTSPFCLPGLSPLARGTPHDKSRAQKKPRFIPAGAGNTKIKRVPPGCRSVYPRWRGEHWGVSGRCHCRGGLSPLARGTRSEAGPDRPQTRFIPAGAGNTAAFPCHS